MSKPIALWRLEDFSSLIREERQRRALSQKALADLVGIDQSQISKYETGKCWPEVPTMIVILSSLGYHVTAEPMAA